jgi:hypothetical protein
VLSNRTQSFIFDNIDSTERDENDATATLANVIFDVRGPRLKREDRIRCLFFGRDGRDRDGEYTWWGLLLEPAGIRKGQFRRIGILDMYSKYKNSPWLDQVVEENWGMGREFSPVDNEGDWLEYEEFDGTGYTVSIV